MPGKANEIPMFFQLIDRISDVDDAVATADAMRAHGAHADHLVLQRNTHDLLTVNVKQPSLQGPSSRACRGARCLSRTTTDRELRRVTKRDYKIVTVVCLIDSNKMPLPSERTAATSTVLVWPFCKRMQQCQTVREAVSNVRIGQIGCARPGYGCASGGGRGILDDTESANSHDR